MIIINSSTRQFTIPGADLVFGVEDDSNSEIKEFQCPRYVGNNLDLAGCFIRMNYRNANGEIDSYLVKDAAVNGDNVVFTWELTPKVTMYKGQVSFVMCVVGPDTKVKWHTTLGKAQVLEGLEPDIAIEAETADVVAQLIAMVEAQTAAVAAEGDAQIAKVRAATEAAETAAVAEIEAKGVNTRNSIPANYAALSEAVAAAAPGIVCEAEGSAVVVNDASDTKIQGLRIFGRSTQDGTPTPEAPVEIVSVEAPAVRVCGKNLLKPKYGVGSHTLNSLVLDVYSDGRMILNGTPTINTGFVFERFDVTEDVILTGCPAGGTSNTYRMTADYYKGEKFVKTVFDLGEGVLIKASDADYVNINIFAYSGTTVANLVFYPMLRLASNPDSTYEPYKPVQTLATTHTLPGIPVTSGGNYTDSDGQQWICDEVDLERGVYVQRVAVEVCDGSADEKWWVYNGTNHEGYARDAVSMKSGAMQNGFCSRFPVHLAKVSEPGVWMGQGNNFIYLHNTKGMATDMSAWLAWLSANPMTLAYPLAIPAETPLSETEIAAYRALRSNYPNTTVLNDAGAHMVVKYAADTKLYIDNKIAALVAKA